MPRREIAELVERLRTGDIKALSRLITLADDSLDNRREIASRIYPVESQAAVIGVTGPAGSGKSSLINQLIGAYKNTASPLAVLAFDPSSRFSGGAVLGDRARMSDYSSDTGVYIRSLAGREDFRGVGAVIYDIIQILSAFGFKRVLIETLGAGQGDTEIARACDLVILALTPSYGDEIQTMKAGLLEIGDLFVINKADLDGAEIVAQDIRESLFPGKVPSSAEAPICCTVATTGEGVQALIDKIEKKYRELSENGSLEKRRRDRYSAHLEMLIKLKWSATLLEELEKQGKSIQAFEPVYREADPYQMSDKLIQEVLKNIRR